MAVPLLLLTAVTGVAGSIFLSNIGLADAPEGRADLDRPSLPFLTAGEERAAVIRLEENQARFQREESERAAAFRSQQIELERQSRTAAIARENAQRLEEIRRLDAVEARRQQERLELLERQSALEFEERERARQARAEEATLDALVKAQAVQASRFQSFARSLPGGFQAALRPDGTFTSIAPGSALTPGDVARGLEPLPFSLPQPTASRITTVPGVFVGASFRFKTIEQANRFLVESLVKGRSGRSRASSISGGGARLSGFSGFR